MRVRFFSSRSRHKYDEDPATVSSTTVNRGIRSISTRLASNLSMIFDYPRSTHSKANLIGINAIIRTIRRRGIVHRLYLGSSCIGDTGCVRLFDFLGSPAGRECRESLTELFLTQNDIGPRGLRAVSEFLRNNTVLRELCLSGVNITFHILAARLKRPLLLESSDQGPRCHRRLRHSPQLIAPVYLAATPQHLFI